MPDQPRAGEVEVGMTLGTANKVASMRHFKTWGWVATDITGATYAQRQARHGVPYQHTVLPDGLGGAVWPKDPS